MKLFVFASMFYTASLPYSITSFLGVPVESGIIMIFYTNSIHTYFFSLSANFSLNRSIDFDSQSNNPEILRMALLESLIPGVDV